MDSYAYQLAVVVDDALQGITHVVRGADLLASTPRQILLQRLLGYPAMSYLHAPIAINASGQKLSKQTRAARLPDDALPVLLAAWRFLDQSLPAGSGTPSTVAEFWSWAFTAWSPAAAAVRSASRTGALRRRLRRKGIITGSPCRSPAPLAGEHVSRLPEAHDHS